MTAHVFFNLNMEVDSMVLHELDLYTIYDLCIF